MCTRPRGLVLLAGIALVLTACEGPGPVSSEPDAPNVTPLGAVVGTVPQVCGSTTVRLLADQTIDVGNVVISNDEENLYVSFQAESGWMMATTSVSVATSLDGIPQRGKRFAPGQFDSRAVHDPPLETVHHAFPLPGDEGIVYVAAHSEVMEGGDEEGAWAEGENQEGPGWGSYVMHDIAGCEGGGGEIGPEGGAVSDGDVTLTFPPGALRGTETISMAPVPDEELPDGALPGSGIDLTPDELTFGKPVTLSITYDDTGLSLEEEMRVAIHVREDDGSWQELETVVDTDTNTATTELSHFSVYSVARGTLRMELFGPGDTPWSSNGSVWEGYSLVHQVVIWNDGDEPINGRDVTVEFEAEGLVDPSDGVVYDTDSCNLETPGDTSYRFTCTLPAVQIEAGGFGVLPPFVFVTAEGSAGTTFDVSAAFRFSQLRAKTRRVTTNIVSVPGADAFVDVTVAPEEVSPIQTVTYEFYFGNNGPGPLEGAILELEVSRGADELFVDLGVWGWLCDLQDLGDSQLVRCPRPEVMFAGDHYPPIQDGITPIQIGVTPYPFGLAEEGQVNGIVRVTGIEGANDPNPDNNQVSAPFIIIVP